MDWPDEGVRARGSPAHAGTTPTKGRIFQHVFHLPENNRKRKHKARQVPTLKPPRKTAVRKPSKKATTKALTHKRRTEPTPAESAAKRENLLEYERRRRETPERREYRRLQAQEQRRKAKEIGKCRDCSEPAIPDQSRCPTCAEKHRVARRQWQANRNPKNRVE